MNDTIQYTPKRACPLCVDRRLLGYALLNLALLAVLSLAFGTCGILLCGLIGFAMVLVIARGAAPYAIKMLPLIQLVFTAVMLLMYHGLIQQYEIPYYAGDDVIFERTAEYLLELDVRWFSDIPYLEGLFYAKGYPLILSWIYRLCEPFGGYHTIIPRLLNGYLWSAIVLMIARRVPRENWEDTRLRVLFLGFALFPNALYISGFVYRDTLVLFLLMICYSALRRLTERPRSATALWQLAKLAAALYLVYYLRSQLLYVIMAMAFLIFFWDRGKSLNVKWARRFFVVLTAFLLLLATGGVEMLMDMNENYNEYRETGVGQGLSGTIFSFPLLPLGIFLRFAWGLLSPFPGGILSLPLLEFPLLSLIQLMTYLGVILQICLIPVLWRGIIRLDAGVMVYLLITMTVVVTTFTFRHMLLIYPFMFEVMADGLHHSRNISKKMMAMLALIIAGAVVYILIR